MGKGNAETNNGAQERVETRDKGQDRGPSRLEAERTVQSNTIGAEFAARRMIERNSDPDALQTGEAKSEYFREKRERGLSPSVSSEDAPYLAGSKEDDVIYGKVDVVGEDYQVKAAGRFTYEGTPVESPPDKNPTDILDNEELEGAKAGLDHRMEGRRTKRLEDSNPYPKGSDRKMDYTYSSVGPNDPEGEQARASAEVREARSINIDPSLENLSGPAVELSEAMNDFAIPDVNIDFDAFNRKVRRVNSQELSIVVERVNTKALTAISKNEKVEDRLRFEANVQILQNIVEDMNNGVIIYTERLPKVDQKTSAELVSRLSLDEVKMLAQLGPVNFIVIEADKRAAAKDSNYKLKYPSLSGEVQNNS